MGGPLKTLIVDDPMTSLSALEEHLSKLDCQVEIAWDLAEAEKRISSDHFDSVITSGLAVAGDPVAFAIKCKVLHREKLRSILYAPSPLSPEDEKFLREGGVDHILRSTKEDDLRKMMSALQSPDPQVPSFDERQLDVARAAAISKAMADHVLRDLASKARKLEEILENSSDVIYELDPYGRIILISKVIETLTGYTREELMGMSALDVTSPDSIEVVAEHISMLLSGKVEPPAVEVGVQTKSGKVIPAEMVVRPIKHKNQVVGILGIGRNVEERKRLEESLRRALNEKDFYLDLMAHDIQNFNQAIIGYLEMILGTSSLDPRLERYAQGAFRQVMQTAQLIAHLKKIADVRSHGRESLERRDLKEILEKSTTNLQSRLDKKLVAITLDCPDTACPILAGDDINELMDLLVSVAMRYSLSDLLHIRVSVSAEQRNGRKFWCVVMSGNNLRLTAPVVKCMISQDYTGCQAIERPDLQLLVARAIVETLDGTIEIRLNENGRGDGFVIRIPQAQ